MSFFDTFLGCLVAFQDLRWSFWVSGIVSLVIASYIRMWYMIRRRRGSIKGPLSTSFSKSWLLRVIVGGEMHTKLLAPKERYGALVRIAPNFIMTSDPTAWKKVIAARSPYHTSTNIHRAALQSSKRYHLRDSRRRAACGHVGIDDK